MLLYFLPDDEQFILGNINSDYFVIPSNHPAFKYCAYLRSISVSSSAIFYEGDYVIVYNDLSSFLLETLEKFIWSCNVLEHEVNSRGLL